MYSVVITSRAERELRRLDRPIKNRISSALLSLANEPRPPGCLKVKADPRLWRIRVGDWRIDYHINDQSQEVTIITIGHRREFYDLKVCDRADRESTWKMN